MLLIKNARLIDAERDELGCLLIENGNIVTIANHIDCDDEHVLDASGMAVMPAFIDMHAHFRSPGYEYKEDLNSGMNAALKGGYGTVCAMANTDPVMDDTELVQDNMTRARALDKINYIQVAALGRDLKDQVPVDYAEIRKYTNMFSNDGATIFSDEFMKNALLESKKYNFIISTHCQPEHQIIERDLKLLAENGGNLHIGHVSETESIALIREGKKSGLNFSCEVTPHHLFSCDVDYKVNPPLGCKEDQMSLIEAIKDGMIDVFATDHAPHSEEDKQSGCPGIDNIETAFQMYWQVCSDHSISINQLSGLMSKHPAELLKLNKGILKEGYDADLVLVDLNDESLIMKEDFVSKSKNTPFENKCVKGKVLMTIVNGEVKYDCR